LNEELSLVANWLLKISRKHRPQIWMLIDPPVKRACDSPEWFRAAKALKDGGLWGGIRLSKSKHAVS
jgi:hypothetical protein